MKCYVGIDLGSTTSKAVVMDTAGEVLGSGITNSRSNYDTATQVAKLEAFISTRLTLLRRELGRIPDLEGMVDDLLDALERNFRLELALEQLDKLEGQCREFSETLAVTAHNGQVRQSLDEVFGRLLGKIVKVYSPGTVRKSDFFRDIVGSEYMHLSEEVAQDGGVPFEVLVNLYDTSIIQVENKPPGDNIESRVRRLSWIPPVKCWAAGLPTPAPTTIPLHR